MQQRRIQNQISESRWIQAYVISVAALVWVIAGMYNPSIIVPGIYLLLPTYLMMELNNANTPIRTYSRMVSCSFIVFATMAVFTFPSIQPAIIMLGFVGFYAFAFRYYQNTHAPGWTLYTFFCIGITSIVWVQTLFFLPVLWVIMHTSILSMSPRSFVTSTLGIILSYWFYAGYLVIKGDITILTNHFAKITVFDEPFSLKFLNPGQALTLSFMLVCAVIGIVHSMN